MARKSGSKAAELLVLKIKLTETDPVVWRRVEVFGGLTLHDLHYVIQCVFEWHDEHLYEFLAPTGGKLTRAALRDGQRYHVMPDDLDIGMFTFTEARPSIPAHRARIGDVLTTECKLIIYEYDFGDSWTHHVKVEKRLPGGDAKHVPRCISGENAAPPEDVGGIYGYYEMIAALKDPESDLRPAAISWLGDDFDIARFDIDFANVCLGHAFRPAPKKPRSARKKQSSRTARKKQ